MASESLFTPDDARLLRHLAAFEISVKIEGWEAREIRLKDLAKRIEATFGDDQQMDAR